MFLFVKCLLVFVFCVVLLVVLVFVFENCVKVGFVFDYIIGIILFFKCVDEVLFLVFMFKLMMFYMVFEVVCDGWLNMEEKLLVL